MSLATRSPEQALQSCPMPQPPALTAEQRHAALEKAAKVRRERAEVKEKLKMGSLTLAELLRKAESDETVGKMKVVSVLESLTGLGKVKAKRLSWSRSRHRREPAAARLGCQATCADLLEQTSSR